METENSKAPIPNRIIRLAELMALVGLTSRSAVNRAASWSRQSRIS